MGSRDRRLRDCSLGIRVERSFRGAEDSRASFRDDGSGTSRHPDGILGVLFQLSIGENFACELEFVSLWEPIV